MQNAASNGYTLHRESEEINFDDSVERGKGVKECIFAPYIRVIGPVDEISMTCTITIDVSIRWRDDELVESYEENGDTYYRFNEEKIKTEEADCWEYHWTPNLVLDNTVDDDKDGKADDVHEVSIVIDPSSKKPMLQMYQTFIKKVQQKFSLRKFPFERFNLCFYFMLEDQPSSEAIFKLHDPKHFLDCMGALDPNHDTDSDAYNVIAVRIVPDVCREEWSKVIVGQYGIINEDERKRDVQSGKFSNLELRVDISRNSFYYCGKIITVSYVVMLLMYTTFFIDKTEIADRLAQGLTLFLTAVAFQFAANDGIPKLPYLTLLDKLLLFMYMALAFGILENVLIIAIDSDEDKIETGFILFYTVSIVFSGLWLIYEAHKAKNTVPEQFRKIYPDTMDYFNDGEKKIIHDHKIETLMIVDHEASTDD